VREKEKGEIRRRSATKWLGDGTEKRAVLSRTAWFVPIFWTKSAISEKLSDEDKKAACFVSFTHSRNGAIQVFPRRSQSFYFSFKVARERMVASFFFR